MRRGRLRRPARGWLPRIRRCRQLEDAGPPDRLGEPGYLARPADVLGRMDPIAGLEGQALLERLDQRLQFLDRDAPVERRIHGFGDQALDDALLGRLVADRLELDLAGRRGDDAPRSLIRGAAAGSPRRTARLRAAASRTSRLATDTRTLTPERWLISPDRRARWVSSATISLDERRHVDRPGRLPRAGSRPSPGA